MGWREDHNKRWDDFAEDVWAILTLAVNELRRQQEVCDVTEDIARFEHDLNMLKDAVDFNKVHELEFRTMRCVDNGFEFKEVLCPYCGHKFGSVLGNRFFEGGQTNHCPDCGRGFDWCWVGGE